MPDVAAIIVTHNSQGVLPRCLEGLSGQTVPVREIIVVDSGSDDCAALQALEAQAGVRVIIAGNVGFARANNLAMTALSPSVEYVVFLNPDTFVSADYVATAIALCRENLLAGMISGKLLGYDIHRQRPTGRLDSTGIFRHWYGRWYDRGQGEEDRGQFDSARHVPALCGALLFCRMQALQSLSSPVFDPDFFLYKEDIELSLRLQKAGWQLWYYPQLQAYHCRGWQENRAAIPLNLRRMAAANEILLYKKHPSPYILWARLKYLLVFFFHL